MKKIEKLIHAIEILKKYFEESNDLETLNELAKIKSKISNISDKFDSENKLDLNLPKELQDKSKAFVIYSDGACRGNPGPGSFATIIYSLEKNELNEVYKGSGVQVLTTNNKMEMTGVLEGLKYLLNNYSLSIFKETPVYVYSDSKYVIEGMNSWILGWKKKDWKKSDGKTPENVLIWQELDELKSQIQNISFHWVKGHDGHIQNEMCDKLCNEALDLAGF